jgi:N-acetyl-anhydromuramyl-L-alanine amidase AmpD
MSGNVHVLPDLEFVHTAAYSDRGGIRPSLVVVHRWGGGSLQGVEHWFENPADKASAHLVYAGEVGPNAGRCVQMVKVADKAWTEAAFNPWGISIESADAIWTGDDVDGFERLARIVAWLCHHYNISATWIQHPDLHQNPHGVCRHGDLGTLGGGHTSCPTTDPVQWQHFMALVAGEMRRGGFRPEWTR